jgi:5-methylcytosine-specific restriction protein A
MPNKIKFHSNRPSTIRTFDPAKRERDKFYSSARWRKLRARHLARHPLCARCSAEGLTAEARVAHHIVDRLDDPSRAYDPTNLESLCPPCHTAMHKTR